MNYKDALITREKSLKDAMNILDNKTTGIVIVIGNNEELLGVITSSDIRMAILNGISPDSSVEKVMNKTPFLVDEGNEREIFNNFEIIKKFPEGGVIKIPVLNKEKKVVDIISLLINIDKKIEKQKEHNSIKKILVVGGAGYLGSVLARRLIERNYKVRILDNLTYGDESIKELYDNKNFELFKGDIRSIPDIIKSIKGVDAVIHLASIVGDPAGSINPQQTLESNYFATKSLAEICKYNQINRLIFASSCSVYGATETEELLDENSKLNPVSLYAETKIRSEEELLKMVDSNFAPTIFRMATLYGLSQRMRFDLAINILTAKALCEKIITIYGGNQWRPFLNVDDAAEAYIKCLEAPINRVKGQIFNIGGNNNNYKLIEIGEKIKRIIPSAELKIYKESEDNRNYKVSFNKAEEMLGFKPDKKIEEGIKEMLEMINKGTFTNYKDKIYHNYEFLNDKKDLN